MRARCVLARTVVIFPIVGLDPHSSDGSMEPRIVQGLPASPCCAPISLCTAVPPETTRGGLKVLKENLEGCRGHASDI